MLTSKYSDMCPPIPRSDMCPPIPRSTFKVITGNISQCLLFNILPECQEILLKAQFEESNSEMTDIIGL